MAERLAIDGGTPVLAREHYQNWPVITDDDRRLVNEVLDSGIVAGATGPQVVALEREWAQKVGGSALSHDRQRDRGAAHGVGGGRCGARR